VALLMVLLLLLLPWPAAEQPGRVPAAAETS
jgi:hypothetical protein